MKRNPELIKKRNRSIRQDFSERQDRGIKINHICRELSTKYYLSPETIYRINYDKNYNN